MVILRLYQRQINLFDFSEDVKLLVFITEIQQEILQLEANLIFSVAGERMNFDTFSKISIT